MFEVLYSGKLGGRNFCNFHDQYEASILWSLQWRQTPLCSMVYCGTKWPWGVSGITFGFMHMYCLVHAWSEQCLVFCFRHGTMAHWVYSLDYRVCWWWYCPGSTLCGPILKVSITIEGEGHVESPWKIIADLNTHSVGVSLRNPR